MKRKLFFFFSIQNDNSFGVKINLFYLILLITTQFSAHKHSYANENTLISYPRNFQIFEKKRKSKFSPTNPTKNIPRKFPQMWFYFFIPLKKNLLKYAHGSFILKFEPNRDFRTVIWKSSNCTHHFGGTNQLHSNELKKNGDRVPYAT